MSKRHKFLMLQTHLCIMISIYLVIFFNIPVPRVRRLQENTRLHRFYTLRTLTAVFCSWCPLNESIYLELLPVLQIYLLNCFAHENCQSQYFIYACLLKLKKTQKNFMQHIVSTHTYGHLF